MAYLLVGGVLNGVDDVLVAGAAAEIAGDALAYLALRRRRVVLQQRHRRHDHPRRAVAALEAVLFPEAVLQRMQVAVRREPLDRRDRRAVGLDREDRARLRAAAVDEDGAGSALAGVAPDVRAGQTQLFAEEVDEEHARVDVSLANLAVDGHRDLGHGLSLSRERRIAYSKKARKGITTFGPTHGSAPTRSGPPRRSSPACSARARACSSRGRSRSACSRRTARRCRRRCRC